MKIFLNLKLNLGTRLTFLFLLCLLFFSNTSSSYSNNLEIIGDELEIDLNNQTMYSEEGMLLQKDETQIEVHNIKRDTENRKHYFKDDFLMETNLSSGKFKLESKSGNIDFDFNEGEFFDNVGAIEIGKITGAKAPNDRVYFASPEIEYKYEKLILKQAWMSTDFNATKYIKKDDLSYHVLAEEIVIEPDKQVTFYNSNLFLGGSSIIPVNMKIFRANIRKDSKVPLFPEWKKSYYYGHNITLGYLFGDRKSSFKGGIAPKYASKMGFMIGRLEAWYETENLGSFKINANDILIYPTSKNYSNQIDYEQRHKRYDVSLNYDYNGDKGRVKFYTRTATSSMINDLNDIITRYEANNRFEKTNLPIKRPKFDETISFYTLDANLKNMGTKKDISLLASGNLTTNKKLYTLMVYDKVNGKTLNNKDDNNLFFNFNLKKDNPRDNFSVNYNYLRDMDPGSVSSDYKSKEDSFGISYLNKQLEIGFDFKNIVTDKYRPIEYWEKDTQGKLNFNNILKARMEYTPKTLPYLAKDNRKEFNLKLGNYDIFKYRFKPRYSYENKEQELDNSENSYLAGVIFLGDLNKRNSKYNKYENIIYQKEIENKLDLELSNADERYKISLGNFYENFNSREGIFYDNSYENYENYSKFIDFELSKNKINLGDLGRLSLGSGFRVDKYDTIHDNDSTLRKKINLKHEFSSSSNKEDKSQKDKSQKEENQKEEENREEENQEEKIFYMNNILDISYLSYSDNNISDNIKKSIFLNKGDNYKVDNLLFLGRDNSQIIYNFVYSLSKDPIKWENKKNENIKNKIDFNFTDKTFLTLGYNSDKRYTSKTLLQYNYNDLIKKDYFVALNLDKNRFSYNKKEIDFNIENMLVVGNSKEIANTQEFKYGRRFSDSEVNFSYSKGINLLERNLDRKLDTVQRKYGVNYKILKDETQSFSIEYETFKHREDRAKTLVNGERVNLQNSDSLKFSYEYIKPNFTKENTIKYSEVNELSKDNRYYGEDNKDEIFTSDLMREEGSNNKSFKLSRLIDDKFSYGKSSQRLKFDFKLIRNEARYNSTKSFNDSFSGIETGIFYTQNKIGLGYKYKQSKGWDNLNWKKKHAEHQFSFQTKMGEISKEWTIESYFKFYKNEIDNLTTTHPQKRALDAYGVSVSKDNGFYNVGVAFEQNYNISKKKYDWKIGLNVTLLAMPKGILGIGANEDDNNRIRPKLYMTEDIKINKIVDEDMRLK